MDFVRVLVRVETALIMCGCLVQAAVDALMGAADGRLLFASEALTVAAIALVAFVPHRADARRIPVTALAVASLIGLGAFPWQGLVMLALLGMLGSRLALAYGARGALAAWLVSAAGIGLRCFVQAAALKSPLWLFLYSTATVLMLLAVLFSALALLATALREVRCSARRLADAAAAQERARIALDLHDALGHGLTTLGVQLQAAERLADADPLKARAYVARGAATANALLDDVRETVGLLRGSPRAASFEAMMRELFEDFAQLDGVRFEWSVAVAGEPSGAAALALFRVVQEALTNVVRHARAASVRAAVSAAGDALDVSVVDDGVGFDVAAATRGTGIASMRERVTALGGTMTIVSAARQGTRLRVVLPLRS